MRNRRVVLGITVMLALALLASACAEEEEAAPDGPEFDLCNPQSDWR